MCGGGRDGCVHTRPWLSAHLVELISLQCSQRTTLDAPGPSPSAPMSPLGPQVSVPRGAQGA